MSKEAHVIDLIHSHPGIWSGVKKDWIHKDGKKKPVIKKATNKMIGALKTADKYPYFLKEKNIIRVSGERTEWMILVPSNDISGYSDQQYSESAFRALHPEESSKIEKLEKKVEEKENEIKRLNNKVHKLEKSEKEEKKGKHGQGPSKYRCSYCDEASSKSKWKSDDHEDEGKCPECGVGVFENAEEAK